jgi:hypothetical protein
MKDIRGLAKAERQSSLEAKQCQCGRWFTIRGKVARDQCFRCEQLEGQAAGS